MRFYHFKAGSRKSWVRRVVMASPSSADEEGLGNGYKKGANGGPKSPFSSFFIISSVSFTDHIPLLRPNKHQLACFISHLACSKVDPTQLYLFLLHPFLAPKYTSAPSINYTLCLPQCSPGLLQPYPSWSRANHPRTSHCTSRHTIEWPSRLHRQARVPIPRLCLP